MPTLSLNHDIAITDSEQAVKFIEALEKAEAMNKMERLTFEGNFCDIARCEDTPGGSFCEYGYCDQRRVWERLKAYEDIGTVEEFAAYKQTVDYAKAKVKEIQDRIDARAGDNYHDETKRTLILEERQGAYITILEAAEAALTEMEERE